MTWIVSKSIWPASCFFVLLSVSAQAQNAADYEKEAQVCRSSMQHKINVYENQKQAVIASSSMSQIEKDAWVDIIDLSFTVGNALCASIAARSQFLQDANVLALSQVCAMQGAASQQALRKFQNLQTAVLAMPPAVLEKSELQGRMIHLQAILHYAIEAMKNYCP